MSGALQRLSFKETLPLLASTYQMGRLVPFIGAGMSRKKLAGWEAFIRNLETAADIPPSDRHPDVRAQRAAAKIRNARNGAAFLESIRKALKGETFDDEHIPAQTKALASIYWPLTISTNYDDLFLNACRDNPEVAQEPIVLGRSAKDCKRVMSALVSPFDREIIWHIQGFLGGQSSACLSSSFDDEMHLSMLQNELVIGHSEYRQVANTAVHFRRCFGEVFRSRSFLFLGSSISEDYFWNLFGEMLELCGPTSVPHFAFLPCDEHPDVRFLAEQMNITVCEYDKYDDLQDWLAELKQEIRSPAARVSCWTVKIQDSCLEVQEHAPLPLPKEGSDLAVGIIVRACNQGFFKIDEGQPDLHARFKCGQFADAEHVVALEPRVFAVRGRTADADEHDAIGVAIRELLGKLPPDCQVLHLHLPSAGGTVPPVYGFIEVVRAFGNWKKTNRPLKLIAYVGSQVLLNLSAQQIDLQELLTSSHIRFSTVLNTPRFVVSGDRYLENTRDPVRRVFYKRSESILRDVLTEVLGDVDDDSLGQWLVALTPSPEHDDAKPLPTAQSLAGKDLSDAGIVFGSVLTLIRASL